MLGEKKANLVFRGHSIVVVVKRRSSTMANEHFLVDIPSTRLFVAFHDIMRQAEDIVYDLRDCAELETCLINP